jgi:hypothetical protein
MSISKVKTTIVTIRPKFPSAYSRYMLHKENALNTARIAREKRKITNRLPLKVIPPGS